MFRAHALGPKLLLDVMHHGHSNNQDDGSHYLMQVKARVEHAAPGDSRKSPEQRTDERISGADIQAGALERDADQRWMRNRNEDASDDCDASIKEKPPREPVTKK